MKPIEWYQEKYKSEESNEIVLNPDGTVDIPLWFEMLAFAKTGLKSKKKRIRKKIVKKVFNEVLDNYLKQEK